jgi:hypothetical protein
MTEVIDRTLRCCAICGRRDLPSYAFVAGLSTCCFRCLTALAARELSRPQPKQDSK